MQVYAYGHDYGNAKTDGVVYYQGQKLSRSIPSTTALGRLSELVNLNVVLGEKDYVYGDTTGEWYVGKLAMTQAKDAVTWRGDPNRYWSRKSLHLLLTVAASLIPDEEFGLNVVTGLPIETYLEDEDSRKKVKASLEGTHEFRFNAKNRAVTIKVERVIMEGAGALFAYGLTEKQKQAVIDVGGHTTDLFAATGQTPMRPYCAGFDMGVEKAADAISKEFHATYGRSLSLEERYDLLYAYVEQKPYPNIYARHGLVEHLGELIEPHLHQVGEAIAAFVSQKWGESASGLDVATSFARVLLVGGGAYYFSKELQRVLPHLQTVQSPHEANALGYAAFADGKLRQALHFG